LPPGYYTVPGAGARIDAFGNMSRGQIVQVLAYFRSFGRTPLNSKRMNMGARTRNKLTKTNQDYFLVPIADKSAGLFPGIWQRSGPRDIVPILLFVGHANYRTIFPFADVAEKIVTAKFPEAFDKAFDYAMRTAK
jgi:hypothetical protein